MTDSITDILKAVEQSQTAGTAFDAIPEDWRVFLSGPDEGEFTCSIHPARTQGVAERIYDRGLAMGRAGTRLEAMRAAVVWLRTRNAAMAA